MDWDVDPAGVKGVLTRTAAAAKPLDNYARTLGTELPAAAANVGANGELGLIIAALDGFAGRASGAITQLTYEINTITKCAVAATPNTPQPRRPGRSRPRTRRGRSGRW